MSTSYVCLRNECLSKFQQSVQNRSGSRSRRQKIYYVDLCEIALLYVKSLDPDFCFSPEFCIAMAGVCTHLDISSDPQSKQHGIRNMKLIDSQKLRFANQQHCWSETESSARCCVDFWPGLTMGRFTEKITVIMTYRMCIERALRELSR